MIKFLYLKETYLFEILGFKNINAIIEEQVTALLILTSSKQWWKISKRKICHYGL